MNQKCIPDKQIKHWNELLDDSDSGLELDPWEDWETIHLNNFKCSIDTRLKSFYFKIKINRKDSPNCSFCDNFPETMTHTFWNNFIDILSTSMTLTLLVQKLTSFGIIEGINSLPMAFIFLI